jgi:hypothetical protein
MHELVREYAPNIGDALVSKGSGVPYYAASDIAPLGFNIGDIMRIGGKTFVLSKAGGNITSVGLGCKNGLAQGVANCAAGATSAAGSSEVTLATGATSGSAGTGAIATDEFKGGYIVLFIASVDKPQVRGITGNTSRTASGTKNVTFYLDSPLTYAFTITTDSGEAMQNPWSYVVQDTNIAHPVVGVAQCTATSGQYLWLQTFGPCFCSPQSGVGVAGALAVYWRHDGSLDVRSNIGTYVSDVYAGFVLAEASGSTQGAPFIMLQIMP